MFNENTGIHHRKRQFGFTIKKNNENHYAEDCIK